MCFYAFTVSVPLCVPMAGVHRTWPSILCPELVAPDWSEPPVKLLGDGDMPEKARREGEPHKMCPIVSGSLGFGGVARTDWPPLHSGLPATLADLGLKLLPACSQGPIAVCSQSQAAAHLGISRIPPTPMMPLTVRAEQLCAKALQSAWIDDDSPKNIPWKS